MRRILFFLLVVLAAVAGCTSPKLTKLEAAMDAVVSKYDTAAWESVPALSFDYYKKMTADTSDLGNLMIKTNKKLLKELHGFEDVFFRDLTNFDDLIFYRYGEELPNYYSVDIPRVNCGFIINNAPYSKFKIKKGRVAKLSNDGSSVFVELLNGSVFVSFPTLHIELEDAEFEKL